MCASTALHSHLKQMSTTLTYITYLISKTETVFVLFFFSFFFKVKEKEKNKKKKVYGANSVNGTLVVVPFNTGFCVLIKILSFTLRR